MPEVISDTSVMQYLFQTDLFSLLHDIYGQIQIPVAVRNELKQGPWIPGLGKGEHEVISLAKRTSDSLVLIDNGLVR